MASGRKAYLVGGGIGSLAAAAFLIRDGGLKGSDITVYEMLPILGGSLDGAGSASVGYSMRGGRMLTTDNYECTWGLFNTIPSLEHPGMTVFEETIAFNERVRAHSKARLIDRDCAILDVTSMGFSMNDRLELLSLSVASEERLGATRITDWLSPSFSRPNSGTCGQRLSPFSHGTARSNSGATSIVSSRNSRGSKRSRA